MTSDFNATVLAVDEKMGAYEEYSLELSDISARIKFEAESLFSAIFEELTECETSLEQAEFELQCLIENEDENTNFQEEYEMLLTRISKLQKKHDALESLSRKCEGRGRAMKEEFSRTSRNAASLCSDALRFMGRYIHDINLVANIKNGIYKSETVYVCIVDSALHPESAEHIRIAQSRGLPTVLTLDRDGAAARRRSSLRDINARSEFDRDEYPLAMFSEGGNGANVFYLDPSDNRGSGSYIGSQLRSLPNGARVRIRVI